MAFRFPCFCGCGEQRQPGAFYKPGHDGKHRGRLKAAGATPDEADKQLPTQRLRDQYRADYENRNTK